MRKIVNFSDFNKILEGVESYEDLLPEFSEYNSILSSFLNSLTFIVPRTKGLNSIELADLIEDIKRAPLNSKASELTKAFETASNSKNSDLIPAVKAKIDEISGEIKKLEPVLAELIEQEKEIEGESRLLDFINKWCDKNKLAILKPDEVKESLKFLESIKIDPRNMFNVFGSDINSLLTQANAVKMDIDAAYENPSNPKLKSAVGSIKSRIDNIVDELKTGTGPGINWSTLNRSQAKERLLSIQKEVSEIVSKYSDITYKETAYGEKTSPIIAKIKEITDKIGVLLSDIIRIEKDIEREQALANSAKEGDLDWSIKSYNAVIGFRRGRWYEQLLQGGDFQPMGSSIISPGQLLKGDNLTYKIENNKWYSSDKEDIDWDSKDWVEVKDEGTIKELNNAYAYKLMKEVEWCIDNNKPLFDKDGQYVPAEFAESFLATPEEAKNFDPLTTSKRIKRKKGYNSVVLNGLEIDSDNQETDSGSDGSGSGGSSDQGGDATPLYLSSDLPRLTFTIKDKIYTNNNAERVWKRDGKNLGTTWFTPGTFVDPKESESSRKLSEYWIRLLNGYWELSDSEEGKKDPINTKNAAEQIGSDPAKVKNFKIILSSLDNQLEGSLKNLTDISRFWGIGKGKTNIPTDAWGSDKEAQAYIKGKDTRDERIEVEVWPDKLGGSSASDDIILKVYKNGGVGISDDDYSDSIWGDWRVDDDGKSFIVEWKMYSKGDSSYDKGWKSIRDYSKGKIGAVTKFSGPVGGGLKPVLDSAMKRFMEVFY